MGGHPLLRRFLSSSSFRGAHSGSGYTVTKRERLVSRMYYGIGIGGLIVIVVILLILF